MFFIYSEINLKKAPGNKLTNSTPLPGKNGNPTFAAVAAGYDKSPGVFEAAMLFLNSNGGLITVTLPLLTRRVWTR